MEVEAFPNEMWIQILHFLEPKMLLVIGEVDRLFNSLGNSEVVWKPLVESLCKDKWTQFCNLKDITRSKMIFYHLIRDSKRTIISDLELEKMCWMFRFDDTDSIPYFPYMRDGKYYNEARYGDQGIPFMLNRGRSSSITIRMMPEMKFSRQKDWGWAFSHSGLTIISFHCQRDDVSRVFVERIAYSEKQKDLGNELFRKGEYWRSIAEYRKGLMYICHEETEQAKKVADKLCSLISSNAAAAHIKLNEFHDGWEAANFAVHCDRRNWKALFRRIMCLVELGYEHESLEDDVHLLKKLNPKDESVLKLCDLILKKSPPIAIL